VVGGKKGHEPVNDQQTNMAVEQVVAVLRRRAPLILLCFVLAAGGAFAYSKHQPKKYTATAVLVFNNNQLSQQAAGLPTSGGGSQQAQQSTSLKLILLGDMAEKTASLLGRGLTKDSVRGSLSASAQGESNIVNVSAVANSPTLAADIVNTYTGQFVKEQQNSNHAAYASALKLVNKQLAALSPKERIGNAGIALQNRAQSLGVLAELRSGNVQVAQAAPVPTAPSSPKTSRSTILGAVLGLLIGLGLAFLLERLDRRIREPKDLEGIYDLPLVGVVPESKALSGAARREGDAPALLPPGEAEAFHLIRAHLRYFNVDRDVRTLLIASAAPGDGKTTIARHLAGAAARMGSRVLLLEADLRRPTLARQLDIKAGPGLADVLIGTVSLSEATQVLELGSPANEGARGHSLDVLVAGAVLPPNPGELVESHAMETLLERAKLSYDLVVVDTPPLTAVSDAFPLLRKVDGVVIVGRVGRNRRDVAERLHHTLTGTGAPLLGVIANGFKTGQGSYGYAYNYSYAPERQSAPPVDASPNGATAAPSEQPVPTVKT
jgi:capsular exopolysaccharide synthesis family protein